MKIQNNLDQQRKNKAGGLILHYFKTLYKGTEIKACGIDIRGRQRDQWNRIILRTYGQLIFERDQCNPTGKGKIYYQMVLEQLDIHREKNEC